MVRMPVTFGGGMTMEYGFLSGFGSPWKRLFASHSAYHFSSISAGRYAFGISDMMTVSMMYRLKKHIVNT